MPETRSAVGEPEQKHLFNGDLLIDETDRTTAEKLYANIYHVLDHPELRETFSDYNTKAETAKKRVNRLGLAAVSLATLALLSSALTPVLDIVSGSDVGPNQTALTTLLKGVHWLLFLGECAGLVGSTIAVGGLLLANKKKEWLEHRYLAEMLRQWHFQYLIFRGKEIEDSCNSSDPETAKKTFCNLRNAQFSAFKAKLENNREALVQALRKHPEAGYQWLHEPRSSYSDESKVLEKVFEAYEELRFNHQALYAGLKLLEETRSLMPLKWPAQVMQRRCEAFTSICLASSLIISLAIVISRLAGGSDVLLASLSGAIVSLMILTVSVRAVQDGLAVPEETQRYNDLAGKVRYLRTMFTATENQQKKLRAMEEMERAALEELKGFLRSYYEARFIVA